MSTKQEWLDFLYEYACFFEEMQQTETQKLEHLLSHKLERIEHSISVQQAMDKRLENLEKKRMELQKKLGFADMPLSLVIEEFPEEERPELERLQERVQHALDEIKFLNQKSMGVAASRLREMGGDGSFKAGTQQAASYGYGAKESGRGPSASMLETKV